jgi:hypothetical protein
MVSRDSVLHASALEAAGICSKQSVQQGRRFDRHPVPEARRYAWHSRYVTVGNIRGIARLIRSHANYIPSYTCQTPLPKSKQNCSRGNSCNFGHAASINQSPYFVPLTLTYRWTIVVVKYEMNWGCRSCVPGLCARAIIYFVLDIEFVLARKPVKTICKGMWNRDASSGGVNRFFQ